MATDIKSGRLSPEQIQKNFLDLHAPLNPMQAIAESARCLFCFDAPCTEACPTGIDIPGFIRKIASGNIHGAAVTILSENIMGGTCANVCPVEELCEQVCVRNTAEEQPVVIGLLQRHATDHLFASGKQPFTRAAESGKHIAVIGAGPAGLSCAHRLAMLGHTVTVYEAREKAGGLNEYGLAAYKMLDERAAKEVEFILDIGGITIKTNQELGTDITLTELRAKFDAVFIGIGHNAVNQLQMENEDVNGVHNAVDFIEDIRQLNRSELPVGRNVVVIGGGNTAIDVAVQVKKLGAENVTLVYRRGLDEMGATDFEQHVAQTNSVLIRCHAQPHQIQTQDGHLTAVEFEYTATDNKGRLAGTGETFTLQADQLFKAIGQSLESSPLRNSDSGQAQINGVDALQTPVIQNGRLKVNEQQRTSLRDVWAGGDCTPGNDLTVVAVQQGKIAAHDIDEYLKNG
jgi:glutamate synthase (NADPH/NADH) small chain